MTAKRCSLESTSRTRADAVSLLGPDHPYVRASERLAVVARQGLVVVVLLVAGSTALLAAGTEWASALGAGATVVLVALAGIWAVLRWLRRERAIDLILEGREGLPLTPLQRERERLLDRRTRLRLAKSIEDMLGTAITRPRIEFLGGAPVFHPPVVVAEAEDLRQVAALLRDEPVGVRGVALVERLLTDGVSPMYGRHAGALREELGRARYLLTT